MVNFVNIYVLYKLQLIFVFHSIYVLQAYYEPLD